MLKSHSWHVGALEFLSFSGLPVSFPFKWSCEPICEILSMSEMFCSNYSSETAFRDDGFNKKDRCVDLTIHVVAIAFRVGSYV